MIVTATNADGGSAVTSAATAVVSAPAVPANTSPPTITGATQEGQTLTAATGSWNGTGTLTYTYAWEDCDSGGNGCKSISGAIASTYTLQKGDVNQTIRVVVSAKDANGTGSATSAQTAVVTAAATVAGPANTVPPTISGTAQEAQTLTATTGSWSGANPITYNYAWQRCDSGGGHCASIGGAAGTTYVVQKADVGQTLRVLVSAKNAGGTSSASSLATAVVTAAGPAAPALTVTLSNSTANVVYNGTVTLSGTVSSKQAGESVTILARRLGDAGFSSLTSVVTGAGGAWSYPTKPTIQTSYEAQWKTATSASRTVGVKPLVTFHVISGHRLSTRVVAGRSFAGRLVQLQRSSSPGRWVTVTRVRLNASSAAIFRATLPKGDSSAADRVQRQSGGRRLPRRPEPHARLPPRLTDRGSCASVSRVGPGCSCRGGRARSLVFLPNGGCSRGPQMRKCARLRLSVYEVADVEQEGTWESGSLAG